MPFAPLFQILGDEYFIFTQLEYNKVGNEEWKI
jgi:hypothetical protein